MLNRVPSTWEVWGLFFGPLNDGELSWKGIRLKFLSRVVDFLLWNSCRGAILCSARLSEEMWDGNMNKLWDSNRNSAKSYLFFLIHFYSGMLRDRWTGVGFWRSQIFWGPVPARLSLYQQFWVNDLGNKSLRDKVGNEESFPHLGGMPEWHESTMKTKECHQAALLLSGSWVAGGFHTRPYQ